MHKNFLTLIPLILSFSFPALSANICSSIPDCNYVIQNATLLIQNANERIKDLKSSAGEERLSVLDVKFIRDTSIPELGEAYRDPKGIIWGDLVSKAGTPLELDQAGATNSCNKMGLELPSYEDYDYLRSNFGYIEGKIYSYAPYIKDANREPKNTVLPNLVIFRDILWTSSIPFEGHGITFQSGSVGELSPGYTSQTKLKFRCIKRILKN